MIFLVAFVACDSSCRTVVPFVFAVHNICKPKHYVVFLVIPFVFISFLSFCTAKVSCLIQLTSRYNNEFSLMSVISLLVYAIALDASIMSPKLISFAISLYSFLESVCRVTTILITSSKFTLSNLHSFPIVGIRVTQWSCFSSEDVGVHTKRWNELKTTHFICQTS